MPNPQLFDMLVSSLQGAGGAVSDAPVLTETLDRLQKQPKKSWRDFSMFWPPRLVKALGEDKLIPFVGAGLSLGAGVPAWTELLRDHLKLTKTYVEDEDLRHDPLTMAEIASQRLGTAAVQGRLRELTGQVRDPTTSHLVIASLSCPIYITTNYDTLLETAWRQVTGGSKMRVVVNDADLAGLGIPWNAYSNPDEPLLFKIHGCIDRNDEHLILTRHDYRHHYRANRRFFDAVREILQKRHVLFAGFSHRDPEATRLVEDAIYDYEQRRTQLPAGQFPSERPHFYSLQFDMLEHTPEIFAARGLVALRPPFLAVTSAHGKSVSLSVVMSELALAHQSQFYSQIAIDDDLLLLASGLAEHLADALRKLEAHAADALHAVVSASYGTCCDPILPDVGAIATQGVYLVDARGTVKDCAVPTGLNRNERMALIPTFFDRPYFRIAKSFRESFVSDSFQSVFNRNATVALCVPLLEGVRFRGLLFAAAQVGAWMWPVDQAQAQWGRGRSVLLVDSNGIALFPPNQEIPVREGRLRIQSEDPTANRGYHYEEILALSRRDALIKHLAERIVPLSQDDDVYELGGDFQCYSVVTEIPKTHWKLAISQPFLKG